MDGQGNAPDPSVPDVLSQGLIDLSLAEITADPVLSEAYGYWRAQRRGRKFPARGDITPRGLNKLLRHTALIAVLDHGADYEYRIVGDACVLAHGYTPQGQRWSQLDTSDSVYAQQCKKIYDTVVRYGRPMAAGGFIARKFFNPESGADLLHCLLLCLPLGEDAACVDYLITFAIYRYDSASLHISQRIP